METPKTLRILSAALVALMMVFAPMSCKKEVKTVDLQGIEKVIVLVTDIRTGEPVSNAGVKVLDYQLVTDAEGKVLFELPSNAIQGDINLVVRKNGYASAGHSLTYTFLKENRSLTMYLKPVGTVQQVSPAGGTITDTDNNEVIIPEGALGTGAQVFMDVQPYTSLPGTGELFPVMSMEIQSEARLDKPVEIRFAAPKGSEFEEGTEVPLLYFDEADMQWKDSGQKLTAGPNGSYLTATVTKMRTYAAGQWQDWQLVTFMPLVVTEITRSTIYTTDVCRYLYGWKDGPDHDMGKGNDPNFSDECTSGTLMGGHADHNYDVFLSPLPPAVTKVPGIQAVVNAAIQAVKDQLSTLVPPAPGQSTNFRLFIGYQLCLEVCWCREVNLDQFRNRVAYTALPVLRIKVGGNTYDIPFLSAKAEYNDLQVWFGDMSEMDKSECHEGGGGK